MQVDWAISMGVCMLSSDYKIEKINKDDILKINKVLIKEIGASCLRSLKEHLI